MSQAAESTFSALRERLMRLPAAFRGALEDRRTRRDRSVSEEELTRLVEELAASNQQLEQFAYVASHDLQEPLRMVAAYTELLGERYRGRLDEEADRYIDYALEGAQRMQALIRDLLAFCHLGQHGTALAPIDVETVLADAEWNLRTAIEESGAIVSHGTLPTVLADRPALVQVFQNLMGNAVKFRRADTPRVRVDAGSAAGEWEFRVSDNGIGIAAPFWESIFEPLQRLHSHAEYAGTGIGLAICKRIVDRHGGRIWVESEPGCGSCFTFTIPMAGPGQRHSSTQSTDSTRTRYVAAASGTGTSKTSRSPDCTSPTTRPR